MSLRSNSSLSGYSIRPPSPSHSTASFYPRPPLIPPNKTLHIGNLRTGPFNGKTVQGELCELLTRQIGFSRLKICENRNLVGCFGVAYFASIQCATDAMNNLQGHPFAGSSKGLHIDYMAAPKKETDSQSSRDDRMHKPQGFQAQHTAVTANQPQGPQNQRRYVDPSTPAGNQSQHYSTHGYLNDLPGPHWGYGSGVSPIDTSSSSPSCSPHSSGEVDSFGGQLGDQPFDPRYGAKVSNTGLQASIYADIRAPTMPSASSEEKEEVCVKKLRDISGEGKGIELKGSTVVKDAGNGQANVSRDVQEETKVALLEFEVLPESQNEPKSYFEKEELKVMLLGPGHEVTDELLTANPKVVAETITGPTSSDSSRFMEAEMTHALKEATIEDSSGSKGVSELVALESEAFVNPQVTANSQLDVDNWDDEF